MALKDAFIAELKHESASTKKLLERVPMAQKDWKPHEKSMTLGKLASHVADIPHWISDIINISDYDFQKHYKPMNCSTHEELMSLFNEKLNAAVSDLEKTGDEEFGKMWTVRGGEKVYYNLPKGIAVRGWGFSHLFHHRGQLSVYLRLLDVPIPGMYGPSADEPM